MCLIGHISLCHLSKFISFCWVRCHSKAGGESNLVRWFGYPLQSDSGSISSSLTQVPTYFPHALQDFLKFPPRVIGTTLHPSCTTPHQFFSKSALHPTLLHTIFSYVFLPDNFLHISNAATPSVVTPTPFTSTQWGVLYLTTK